MVPMATWKMSIRFVITNVYDQIIATSVVTLQRSICFFWRGLLILRMDIRKGARISCWHASFGTEWLLTTCEWNYLPHQLIQYKQISIYIRKGARISCWHARFGTEWLLTTCEWNYLPHQLIQYKQISIYRTFAAKK